MHENPLSSCEIQKLLRKKKKLIKITYEIRDPRNPSVKHRSPILSPYPPR